MISRDNPPVETGNKVPPPTIQEETDPAAFSFVESVRKVFAPCVGVVDAASFLMGNCRFGTSNPNSGYETNVATRLRNGAMAKTVAQKRQGETLEIPAYEGFDDDVSAISAHTLEEMERLRMVRQRQRKLQTLNPPSSRRGRSPRMRPNGNSSIEMKAARGAFTSQHLWAMPAPMGQHQEEDCSIGVSTSGSSSAEEQEPARITKRGSKKSKKQQPSLKTLRTAA
ncbi:MAG: hypothetical protein SGILL_006038 [Bacillariaceae sp.]